MNSLRSDTRLGSERAQDGVQSLLHVRLGEIHELGKVPLVSADMDDTLLPFGNAITESELELLIVYADSGGHLAINTLASREWFYLRVVDRLVNTFRRKNRAHLLRRVHWIVSGGQEIFVYDSAIASYRRIYAAPTGNKVEGLVHLLHFMDGSVAILAFYGDRFDDPDNDGCFLGNREIPVIVNVGADQDLPRAGNGQIFVNAIDKGPAATLRDLAFVSKKLRERPRRTSPAEESVLSRQSSPAQPQPWSFGAPVQPEKSREVEVGGPGFVWSWNGQGQAYLSPLVRQNRGQATHASYRAGLPDGIDGFTFFWTGGPDAASGHSPGHWEGRDFRVSG